MAKRKYQKPRIDTRAHGARREAPADDTESTTQAKAKLLVDEPEAEVEAEEAEEITEGPDPIPQAKPKAEKVVARPPMCSNCHENRCFKGKRGENHRCPNCRQLAHII